VYNCKVFYSTHSLKIFISFYITRKTIFLIHQKLTKLSTKFVTYHKLCLLKKKQKKFFRKKKRYKLFYKKKFLNSKLKLKKKKKQKKINKRIWVNSNQHKTINLKEFQVLLLESLSVYTKNKINILITLQNLNAYKYLQHTQLKNLKVIFKQLKKFIKNNFFKEAINVLFVNISKRKSAKLLANFLTNQLKLNQLKTDQITIARKDNYFLGFLKQSILLLIKSENSCLKGIKIVIKGRFNKAPRSKTNIIHLGKCPLQSFNTKVEYYQSTSYTSNGTFGVKI